jgi:hypothetical protein
MYLKYKNNYNYMNITINIPKGESNIYSEYKGINKKLVQCYLHKNQLKLIIMVINIKY